MNVRLTKAIRKTKSSRINPEATSDDLRAVWDCHRDILPHTTYGGITTDRAARSLRMHMEHGGSPVFTLENRRGYQLICTEVVI